MADKNSVFLFKRGFALVLLVLVIALLLYAVWPFRNAFFGAFILFVLFLPFFNWLNKFLPASLSALIVVFVSFFLIIIPLFFILGFIGSEVFSFVKDSSFLSLVSSFSSSLDSLLPGLGLGSYFNDFFANAGSSLGSLIVSSLHGFLRSFVNLLLMFFILYFLLVDKDSLKKRFYSVSPFNKKNTRKIAEEFSNITFTTLFASGLLALLQGFLIALGFFIFGLHRVFFWGFVAVIFSFLPVIGISLIWVPAVVFLFLNNNYFSALGLLLWGLFSSNIDNFIRPFLHSKIGRIHPLITLLGVFVGVPVFGLLGLILGPLLLSYSVLIVKIFVEEFVV